MNPQNQYVDNGHDPYAFIMNPSKPPKRKLFGFDPFIAKIVFILGGALLLMMILAIVFSALGGSKVSSGDLLGLAQTQQELIRISYSGKTSSVQQTTKNLAITTEFTMKSQQAQTLAYMSGQGIKVKPKDLKLKQNATVDQQFTNAKQTSTFDLVFSQIIQKQLQDYANAVKLMHDRVAGEKLQDMLSSHYEQTQLLISQVPYAQQDIKAANE